MANPTTNYGWVLPTPTDLVTDLPADFDVALQGVDTTTKALNPSTTLGDIEYRSATANTNTRLGIGTSGQVLTVAAGVPSWATATSGGMTLISTTTLTGTSVTLSSIPQTYNTLYLVIRNFAPAAGNPNGTLKCRVNSDSGANRHYSMRLDGDVSGATGKAFDATSMTITANNSATTFTGISAVTFWDYTNTTTWKFASASSIGVNNTTVADLNPFNYFGIYNQTAAITSLVLLPNTSTMGGTALLYGVK
jgi:hypothetical protein